VGLAQDSIDVFSSTHSSIKVQSARTVSAVLITYFTGPLLARSIDALRAQENIQEIIVVNNGNWDGAVEEAIGVDHAENVSGNPPITVLSGHGNVGFARACNLGARKAKGDFLLFINPDAIMPSEGLARLIEDGATLKRPWVMGAKLINPDGTEQQGSRRETLTPWRAFVEATKLYNLAPRHPYFRRFNLHSDPCPAKISPVPTISGACFILYREDYFRISGMDENYFLHVEDVDFCLRFVDAGGSVYFNPHVEVLHFKSSSRVNPLLVEARKTKSMIRYFRTHFSEPYPAGFIGFVALCLWMIFGFKAVAKSIAHIFGFIGLGARPGAVYRKASEQAAHRRSR